MDVMTASKPVFPLTEQQIQVRLRQCSRLPSLSSIHSALRELLTAEQRYTTQISEIIRRDPSLTARLLRLVNSVYYGLSSPVNSIEEAVFYLGVRQIRQLAMVTPVIEDFQRLAGNTAFPWRGFWQHCIGVAILTREVISAVEVPADESDYVAGLIHDVGKIIMAAACPEHFAEVRRRASQETTDLLQIEKEVLGIDHAELGARYLEGHNLPEVMIETARFHAHPERSSHHARIVGAVQIANLMIRYAQIGESGNPHTPTDEDWLKATGWGILYPHIDESNHAIARAALKRSLDRLPTILEGLV
ncbi:MAG TPA: histidine kinase [Verrucomicrobiales bacterium]|nr:histidine kinase [Verrucomicrobiales bacterium]